ncbi:MAG: prolipoprotein diacylglyceryl transferase [Candidatus Omnitrophota bacterium]
MKPFIDRFIVSWQYIPFRIGPVAFTIGPIKVHWYGLMYLAGFLVIYLVVLFRLRKKEAAFSKDMALDFLSLAMLGALIGGRLGYVLFYDMAYFLENPLKIFLPFDISGGLHYIGIYGMSYHGGLIGVIVVSILFCRKRDVDFWRFSDLIVPAIPLGYFFGRIGNFINGELYGRITNMPWGMYFPLDVTNSLRHPSQIYEAFFEGIFLFIILWSLRKIGSLKGKLFLLYIIGYGLVRFFIEFFREPDSNIGFILDFFTLGQIFCLFMILAGSILILRKKE